MQRAVCPPALKGGHFTTGAVDNIDRDPSSTSAHGSFHGTGISLFEHPPADTNFSEVPRVVFTMPDDMATNGILACLPETYTSIPPATLSRQDPFVPKQEGPNKAACQLHCNTTSRTAECQYAQLTRMLWFWLYHQPNGSTSPNCGLPLVQGRASDSLLAMK